MTSKEFVIWLKGFTEGVHEFAITPKQWDYLKEKLAEVNDGTPIGEGGWGTPNTTPMWQQPHYPNPFDKPYIDPYNPYKITCSSGSFGTITTTPGTGYITTYNPIQFGSGSYNPSSITYGYPSGSAWSYTTSNEKVF
jgi:hypothetical protein